MIRNKPIQERIKLLIVQYISNDNAFLAMCRKLLPDYFMVLKPTVLKLPIEEIAEDLVNYLIRVKGRLTTTAHELQKFEQDLINYIDRQLNQPPHR
jgi:hypothetical protein